MFPRCFLLSLLALVLALAGVGNAATVVAGPTVVPLGPESVTVQWTTDVPTGTRVLYGRSAERLNERAEGAAVTDRHEVTLRGLQGGTRYFFAVGTARRTLAAGSFITASSPGAGQAPASTSAVATTPRPVFTSPTPTPSPTPALATPTTGAATPRPASATPRPASLLGKIMEALRPEKVGAPPVGPPPTGVAEMAPPTRVTWGNLGSLRDHYERHGGDFGARSEDDYAAQAWRFRERARRGELLVKVDETGVQRVYDPATGAFAAYNRDGTTKTYFKPGSPSYFERQPGRPMKGLPR